MELETELSVLSKIKNLVLGPISFVTGFIGAGTLTLRGLVLLCTVGMLTGIYLKGRADANLACAKTAALGVSKSVKEYGAITKKTNGMDERQLDSYLSKWMRD